ncbi:MAG: bifunctional 4-hydroxy-2-oxoglutarate aldolase/2-dehydro-3-deoxy-phosphogluconate aldolase [Flavihumibacter sp.]
MNSLQTIYNKKVIAILRGVDFDALLPVAEALYEGGLRLLEITLNSPRALEGIAQLNAQFGKRPDKMLIGAGTVLDVDAARAAIDAGAKFIISPNTDAATIRQTLASGVLSLPGAYTATEIVTAHRAGGQIIKVFPAADPAYFRNLKAPLDHIPMMPTGGVNIDNIAAFKAAGAVAFGIGSALVKAGAHDQSSLENLIVKSRQLMAAVS